MSEAGPPALSVCVVTGRFRLRTERCLDSLLAQDCLDKMEILVVDVSRDGLEFAQRGHPAIRYLHMPEAETYSGPRTLALDHARAPLLAYLEDHALAGPGWAREVMRAFEDERNAIVVYGFGNANPANWVSRMFLLMAYGRWMTPAATGPVPFGPGNNVAYRRAVLMELRAELPALLGTEMFLQRRIAAHGGVIWHAAGAPAFHENWLDLAGCEIDLRICCRQFAAHRVAHESMNWPLRILFAGGMVLMPGLHLLRLGRNLRRADVLWREFVQFLPVMFGLYVCASVAEACGYLFGIGRYDWKRLEVEVHMKRDMA